MSTDSPGTCRSCGGATTSAMAALCPLCFSVSAAVPERPRAGARDPEVQALERMLDDAGTAARAAGRPLEVADLTSRGMDRGTAIAAVWEKRREHGKADWSADPAPEYGRGALPSATEVAGWAAKQAVAAGLGMLQRIALGVLAIVALALFLLAGPGTGQPIGDVVVMSVGLFVVLYGIFHNAG